MVLKFNSKGSVKMKNIKIIVTNQLKVNDKDAVQTVERLQATLIMKYWKQFYQSTYGPLSGAIVQEGDVFYVFNETQTQLLDQIKQIVDKIENDLFIQSAFVQFEIDLINENDFTYLASELESIIKKSYFNLKIA